MITAMQALEALDELESSARGDEPFNHAAAPVVRAFIESTMLAAPQAQPVGLLEQALQALETYVTIKFGGGPGPEQLFNVPRVKAAGKAIRAHLAATRAQPAPEPERPAGVVIFPNDQFREAFRKLIDTGDKP